MTHQDTVERILTALRERHPRYRRQAYVFMLDALNSVMTDLQERRHISGKELADSVRELAISRFGPLARTVLEYWGVYSTGDLGAIVFALVEIGVLVKQEEDALEDFDDLFDFEEVFDRNYPWAVQP